MKKTLAVLSLIAILSSFAPSVMAAPAGHGGHHGGAGMHGGHGGRPPVVHHAPPPRHHSSAVSIVTGIGARPAYWSYPYCDYRLGCYDYYYPVACPRPYISPVANVGLGFNFRF